MTLLCKIRVNNPNCTVHYLDLLYFYEADVRHTSKCTVVYENILYVCLLRHECSIGTLPPQARLTLLVHHFLEDDGLFPWRVVELLATVEVCE